jgi:hypothetical protein
MLTLPIKKKWFDMIKSGNKKEEYREIKPYWTSRFSKYNWALPFEIIFRNGYGNSKPAIKCNVKLETDYGCTNWGAEIGKVYYVLKILSVEEVE